MIGFLELCSCFQIAVVYSHKSLMLYWDFARQELDMSVGYNERATGFRIALFESIHRGQRCSNQMARCIYIYST